MSEIKTARLYNRGSKICISYIDHFGLKIRKSVGDSMQTALYIKSEFDRWLFEGKDPWTEYKKRIKQRQVQRITLGRFYNMYMDNHGRHQSKNRQVVCRDRFKHIARYDLAQMPVSEINKKNVATYMSLRQKECASNATINKEVVVLRIMMSKAVEWEVLSENKLSKINLLPEGPKRDVYLEPKDAEALLNALPPSVADIIAFAMFTGFRKENILSLRIENIRFDGDDSTVHIVLKGQRPETFTLAEQAIAILKDAIGNREVGYVFLSPKTGDRYKSINNTFSKYVRELELAAEDGSKLRIHDLRHAFAGWLANEGITLDVIRQHMGHKKRATTGRYAFIKKSSIKKSLHACLIYPGKSSA